MIRLSSSGSVMVWVVLLEAHQVHGFTYFDQVVKFRVYDSVVGLLEAHEIYGFTHYLVTTIAANQERVLTLGLQHRFAQTLLRESLLEGVRLETKKKQKKNKKNGF